MSRFDFGFKSLFADVNKTKAQAIEEQEGVIEELDELTLDLDDEELIKLKNEYEGSWNKSESRTRVKDDGDRNEKYWLGKQAPDDELNKERRPYVENIIFEGLETFLPIATKKNPEPLVKVDESPEMQVLASKTSSMLSYIADKNNLKLLTQQAVRHWSLRYVGVIKIGWDAIEDEVMYKVIRPTTLILDDNATITNGEYNGEYLGEAKEDTARNLMARFPKKKDFIKNFTKNKMGSIVKYREWWTREYYFCTLEDEVLFKSRNPHWNYGIEEATYDEYGTEIKKAMPGKNHFRAPKIPYAFLNVFSLGDSPVDRTTLISQIRNFQDLINERGKQLNKNIRSMNGGLIVSGQSFNKEQAAQVGDAWRDGRTVRVPVGDINTAAKKMDINTLPPEVYQSIQDYRSRALGIMGTSGSTPQSSEKEDTVRGKIILGNQDESRIGGGVTNYIEAMDAFIYNYTVQMMYVYYDEPHIASVVGPNSAAQFVQLQNTEFPQDRKIFVGVQEGSLIPKDELTQRNEAMDLWAQGAIDPITLNERLHDSDPEGTAYKLFLWQNNPMALFQNQMGAQQGMVQGTGAMPPTGGDGQGIVPPGNGIPPVVQESNQLIKSVPMGM